MKELLRVEVPVHFDDVVEGIVQLDYPQIIALICQIDLRVAEVGFTEELVKKLVTSLKADKDDVDLPFLDWAKV